MMLKIAVLSAALLGCLPGMAYADDRGSKDDQAACEPDVHRLCDRFIPDEAQIVACLQAEKKHLSKACAKVMSRP